MGAKETNDQPVVRKESPRSVSRSTKFTTIHRKKIAFCRPLRSGNWISFVRAIESAHPRRISDSQIIRFTMRYDRFIQRIHSHRTRGKCSSISSVASPFCERVLQHHSQPRGKQPSRTCTTGEHGNSSIFTGYDDQRPRRAASGRYSPSHPFPSLPASRFLHSTPRRSAPRRTQ